MRSVMLPIVFFVLAPCLYGQIPESSAIDSIFSDWNTPNSPGGALGVIKDGKLIYAKGYGLTNLEYDIPNTPHTVFRIASTSKQFTAACIVLLAQQGKLSLDDTVDKFFPEFPDYAKEISIRHLLNHTSGIRDYLTLAYLQGFGSEEIYTDEDIMKWLIRQKELNFSPGEKFLYSNSGYWLLGQIVNTVAGENMADFAQKELFDPLNMQHTHFHNNRMKIVKNRASGYVPDGNEGYLIYMTQLEMIGDGGVFTTITDMKKWDDAFYDKKIFGAEFWEIMTQKGVLNNGKELRYASGLFIDEYKGLRTISHGGAFVGFRAGYIQFPEQRFSVIIFANRGDANPTGMGYQVAEIFLESEFKNESDTKDQSAPTVAEFITLDSTELDKFTGHYWNSEKSYSRKIYLKDDTLRYYRSEYSENSLLPIGDRTFKMIGISSDLIVKFDARNSDDFTMVVTENGGDPIISKAYVPVSYSPRQLKKFTGSFYSAELDILCDLKWNNDALAVYIHDEEIGSVEPIMENILSSRKMGVLYFNKDAAGNIIEFKLAAGRVKNLKFVKQ